MAYDEHLSTLAGACQEQAGPHGAEPSANPDQQASLDGSAAASQHQQGEQATGQGSLRRAPVAGNEGNHAAVKLGQPQGVPDRVPAAVALEASEEPAAVRSSQTERPDAEGGTVGEEEPQELKQPRVVEGQQQQQQQQKKKASPTPVFVPIVVAMEAQDHKVMVEEWYSRQMVSV